MVGRLWIEPVILDAHEIVATIVPNTAPSEDAAA
jgi:hypothetical protein